MNELGMMIQARSVRATWDRPRESGILSALPVVLAGLALAMTLLVGISYAGTHGREGVRMLARVARATALVLEGG